MNFPFAFKPANAAVYRNPVSLQLWPSSPAPPAPHRAAILLRSMGVLLLLAFVAGCGGGPSASNTGASRGTGKLQVTVIWPPYQPSAAAADGKGASHSSKSQNSRYIAPNATRIQITVTDNFPTVGHTQTFSVTRDPLNSMHTFTGLPAGDLPVLVEEFDDNASAGASVAVARNGADVLHIVDNTTATLMVAPGTTIDHVNLALPSPPVKVNTQGAVVSASARNSANNLVPIPLGVISFASLDTSIATVVANTGSINPIKVGIVGITATISIQDAAIPNPTATQPLNVTLNNVTFTSPTELTLAVQSTLNTSQQTKYGNTGSYSATVPGDGTDILGQPRGVSWRLLDSNKAPVSNVGNVIDIMAQSTTAISFTVHNGGPTAANVSGVYYLRATSNQDTTVFADAKLTILSGIASVTVN